MRIATWNVNGLRARIDYVLHWLQDRQPDLLGLQELKLTEDQFPVEAFERLGYRAIVMGQKAWNGVAVVSRNEPELVQAGLPGHDELGARLVTARAGDLLFTSVYVPNGKSVEHEDYGRKLAWLDDLVAHAQTCWAGEESVVVCGDFNVCPTGLDSWNEEALGGTIFHTEAERERIRALHETGLVDLFRHRFPEERSFTWWDYRGGAFPRGMGLRIDFLLGSPGVAERVTRVEHDRDYRKKIDDWKPSDHAPVWADLG